MQLLRLKKGPASLVLTETFGSEPYDHIACHDSILLVSGSTGAGANDESRYIDILQYSDEGFNRIGRHKFDFSQDSRFPTRVLDIKFFRGYWVVLLSDRNGVILVTASIINNQLQIENTQTLNVVFRDPELVTGHDNNIYLVDTGNSLKVTHLKIEELGTIQAFETVNFGETPNEPSYNEFFSVSFDNQSLYLTSNQHEEPAYLYRLPLEDTGAALDPIEITFDDAESKYSALKVVGDFWFFSYRFWGFHVAKMEENSLSLIYQESNDVRFNDFIIDDNVVFGIDTFGEIRIYVINEDDSIDFVDNYRTTTFLYDASLSDNTLFVTRNWSGIEAISIENPSTLTSLHTFNESGEVVDFSLQDGELAVNAMDKNLHFWSLGEGQPSSLNTTFNTLNTNAGVAWDNEYILLNNSGFFESHLVANAKNNIDVGERHGSLGTSGRDGQIVELENGYLAQSFGFLNFFDQEYNKLSSFELSGISSSSIFIQEPVAYDNLLFVPTLWPSEVIIYDTSDLAVVAELSRISRSSTIKGNVAVSGNYLYVPTSQPNGELVITIYDISDPSDPVTLPSFNLPVSKVNEVTLHINEGFLIVVNDKGALFDLTDPTAPVLIDENSGISTNGIGKGFDEQLFTVSLGSGGVINRTQINFAPEQADLLLETDEDMQGAVPLMPEDNENDEVSFSLSMEPALGSITIENESLSYQPFADANGADRAELLVTDVHGGATIFSIDISILPVNDPPAIEVMSIRTQEDNAVTVDVIASDVDSETLIYSILAESMFGSAEVSEAGQLTYTPIQNYFGEDTIEIEVSDQLGLTDSSEFIITINPVNDLPIFTGDLSKQANEDEIVELGLTSTDVDGDTVEYEIVSLPDGWSRQF